MSAEINTELARIDTFLDDSDRKYRLIFDSAPCSMWVFDIETLRILAVNETAIQRYGYSREEFLQLTLWDLRPHDERASFVRALAAVRGGREAHGVYRHRTRDGRIVDVRVDTRLLPFSEGRLHLAQVQDITEAKSERDALHFLESLSAVLSASLEAVTICRNLAQLTVPRLGDWCVVHRLEGNGALRATGWAHADPLRQQLLSEAVLHETLPVEREACIRAALSTGATQQTPCDESTSPSGRVWLTGEVLMGAGLFVPIQGQGRTLGVLECIRERTADPYPAHEVALAEELARRAGVALGNALQLEEARDAGRRQEENARRLIDRVVKAEAELWKERIQGILRAISDGLFMLDAEWRFTLVNEAAERTLGFAREELLGKSIWQIFPEAIGSDFYHEYHRAVETQTTVTFEKLYEAWDRWFSVRAHPSDEGLTVYFRDVTDQKRQEQALHDRETELLELLENTSDLVHSTTPDGRILFANQAWCDRLGYLPTEMRELSIWDVLAPDCHDTIRRVREQVLAGNTVEGVEATVVARDGSRIRVRGNYHARRVGGRTVAVRAVFRDLSEQRELAVERERIAKEAAALERAKLAFLDRVAHELRTPLTSVIGFSRLLQASRSGAAPLPPEREGDYLARIVANGRVLLSVMEGILEYVELETHHAEVQPAATDLAALVRDVVEERAATGADLGAQPRAEVPVGLHPLETDPVRLRQLLGRLVEMVAQHGEGGSITLAVIADPDGRPRAVEVRGEAPSGALEAMRVGADWPDQRGSLELGLAVARALCHLLGMELEQRGDGFRIHLGACPGGAEAEPSRDAAGGAVSELGEQRLELLGRMAAGIAHDFGNLLNVILGNVQLALIDLPPNHPTRSDLEEIRVAAEQAVALIRQILLFSRQQVAEPGVIDVRDSLAHTAGMLRRTLGAHIALRTVVEAEPCPVFADPAQITQVLLNLAVNARDAMPEGGTLVLEVHHADVDVEEALPPGRYVQITVRDTGRGIEPEHLPHIFEPFFTTKEPGRGTGLGLASVREIVQAAAGHLRVRSTPGLGTAVYIYLPRIEGGEGAAEPLPRVAAAGILVVDADDTSLSLTHRMLSGLGHSVLRAATADEALALAQGAGSALDLVILDPLLSGMTTADLLGRLQDAAPGIAVLLASTLELEEVERRTGLHPVRHLVRKPFTRDVLAGAIQQALGERKRPAQG